MNCPEEKMWVMSLSEDWNGKLQTNPLATCCCMHKNMFPDIENASVCLKENKYLYKVKTSYQFWSTFGMHGWWEYPSNVLERKEMLLTAVVVVVRHKSVSFFFLENKKQWKKQKKHKAEQLNEWKLHSLAWELHSHSENFVFSAIPHPCPRELNVIPKLQDSVVCHVLHVSVREGQGGWDSQSYYKEYFVDQMERFIFSSDWHSSICANKC